jgi:hypothetical protein
MFRRKFNRYKYFALSTEQSFFTEEEKKDVLILTGNYDRSAWVENLGNGKFEMHELPIMAQVAPTQGILADDVNGDGFSDILMVGNDYGNEIFIGRLDASVGLLLLGDGNGNFKAAKPMESGFVVPGDAKALVKLSSSQGSPIYFASQNRGKLLAFKAGNSETKTLSFGQEAMALILELENGKMQRYDLSVGSGFGSQSSREVTFPKGAKSAVMVNYKGEMVPVEIFTRN